MQLILKPFYGSSIYETENAKKVTEDNCMRSLFRTAKLVIGLLQFSDFMTYHI